MDEHCDEEDTVKVRDGGGRADDQAPGEAHGPVGDVVLYAPGISSESSAPGFVVGIRTGLRENCHQPLVRSRLLRVVDRVRLDSQSIDKNEMMIHTHVPFGCRWGS